ncbi:MAG: CoA transferase subunit A, partial [Anaerolineales bacterium]
ERVILTAEEIVSSEVIRSDPNRTVIPGLIVDAVCAVPHCAHPSYAQGYYDRDNEFYVGWDQLSADPARAERWLQEWVLDLPDRDAYWQKLGPTVHARLAVEPRWSTPVNYGAY